MANAPAGTEVAIFDLGSAFHNIPIAPKNCPYLAMSIPPFVHFDNVLNFGLRSSPRIFGNIANAMVKILLYHGIEALIKWVDDFIFFCYPLPSSTSSEFHFSYDESTIFHCPPTWVALGPQQIHAFLFFLSLHQISLGHQSQNGLTTSI